VHTFPNSPFPFLNPPLSPYSDDPGGWKIFSLSIPFIWTDPRISHQRLLEFSVNPFKKNCAKLPTPPPPPPPPPPFNVDSLARLMSPFLPRNTRPCSLEEGSPPWKSSKFGLFSPPRSSGSGSLVHFGIPSPPKGLKTLPLAPKHSLPPGNYLVHFVAQGLPSSLPLLREMTLRATS